jgi:hypothetical protein
MRVKLKIWGYVEHLYTQVLLEMTPDNRMLYMYLLLAL